MYIFLLFWLAGNPLPDSLDLMAYEQQRSLEAGTAALDSLPQTITQFPCERSAGSIHDFYSEGDYWWPDPENPDGPYIRKDGASNPDNFIQHRLMMIRLSEIAGALGAAYKYTGDEKFAMALINHLQAWFVNPQTKMNPNMLYAQAIKGRMTGRGIGIIDTIHLMEVVMAIRVLKNSQSWKNSQSTEMTSWFDQYLQWLTSHPFGADEKNNGNNHSTTYALQVAAYAMITENTQVLQEYELFFKDQILGQQMDSLGRFPKELSRTKPYAYSIFNLDAMASIAQILSLTKVANLYNYESEDVRSLKKGIEFMAPFLESKENWPYPQDVSYWFNLPWKSPALLFFGMATEDDKLTEIWKNLKTDNNIYEIRRNTFVRFPVIWF